MGIRILLVDDHKIVRDGLRLLLISEPDMEVVAETGDWQKSMQLVKDHSPDIVIVNINMPDIIGMEAIHQISTQMPNTKVLALSMSSCRHFLIDLFKAGAKGYVTKECGVQEVIAAIHTLAEGKSYLSSSATTEVIDTCIQRYPFDDKKEHSPLTDKELYVTRLLSEGKTTKEIALDIQMSDKTVDAYRRHIMDKLKVNSVAHLTKYAIREGLTSLEN